jgi:Polyketide cyclase / dehydrase and lipid transport
MGSDTTRVAIVDMTPLSPAEFSGVLRSCRGSDGAWRTVLWIDTQNLPSASVPFKNAESTLTVEPDAEGTLATFDYRYAPRGGPLGRLAGPLIDKMLTGTFTDMLAATDEAARADGSER